MRKEYYRFTLRTMMGLYAKLLYEMSPGNAPFRATDVMAEAREAFQSAMVSTTYEDVFIVEADIKAVYKPIEDLLMDKPGFRLLNYTKNLMRTQFTDDELATAPLGYIYEHMKEVKNDGIRFLSRYDKPLTTQEEWDNDFIDLDAFIGNFVHALVASAEPMDCFFCDHAGKNSAYCKKCNLNESLKNHYKLQESPCAEGVTVCDVGCPKGLKICCSDCKEDPDFKNTHAKDCPYACDDTPETCKGWRFKGRTENPELIQRDQQDEEAFAKAQEEEDHGIKDVCTERYVDECCDSLPVQPQDH